MGVRVLGLVSLLASVAVAGYLMTRAPSPAAPVAAGESPTQLAEDAAAASTLTGAAQDMEAARALDGTYAGADVSRFPGVVLRFGDARRYCLEYGSWSLAGPGGRVAAGRCA